MCGRRIIGLNDNWVFNKEGENPEPIMLPHTWNAFDGQDGGNDYYRGCCLYERELGPVDLNEGDRVFLEFDGVFCTSDVLINGVSIFHNECGFSTFRFDITDFLTGSDLISVYVDNSRNKRTYPQIADFTFFGGIYREVKLLIVPAIHFNLSDYGGSGVRVWTEVSGDYGIVKINAPIVGEGLIRHELIDSNGYCIAEAAGESCSIRVPGIHLWNGLADPYLYSLHSMIVSEEIIVDELSQNIGFRSFYVDPSQGFFLNGELYPLRGVAMHQDREDKGWAVSKEDHEEDLQIIKDLGANTIRLSHYQHSQFVYDLCDKYGFLVWTEIPYISAHFPSASQNAIDQMKCLLIQNLHHCSIICWGLSNEISMLGLSRDVYRVHSILNDLCHSLDPTRPTTLANLGSLPISDPLVSLTDLESYNIYRGWYYGDVESNLDFIDEFHAVNPDIPIGYSEYGAEAVIGLHAENPTRGDYSEEYQAFYHEKMLEIFSKRPFMWATHVWNMFDFAADRRNEGGVQGRNNKGLVTFDRKTKKESFYVYKSWWSKEPFVYVAGKRFRKRGLREIEVRVYSNQPEVSLYLDGKFIDVQSGNHVFRFKVNLPLMKSVCITAKCGELSDSTLFEYSSFAPKDTGFSLPGGTVGLVNWFESECTNRGFTFKPGFYSIRDSYEIVMANDRTAVIVMRFLHEWSDLIGISIDQFKHLLSGKAISTAFSTLIMGGIADSIDRLEELNSKLSCISRG